MTTAQMFEQKGIERGRREVAIRLIKEKPLSDERIVAVTGLSLEAIQTLKRQRH